MKNVMISEQLFLDLTKYHILEKKDAETEKRICSALIAKFEAMERRDAYTLSKTADSPEAREAARLKYLDLAGIHGNFRK